VSSSAATAVVTDTTAYLPEELIAQHGIHRVSLYVTLDGEQRRESEISSAEYDDFYV
jgi:fatty acid-binding protein DegV